MAKKRRFKIVNSKFVTLLLLLVAAGSALTLELGAHVRKSSVAVTPNVLPYVQEFTADWERQVPDTAVLSAVIVLEVLVGFALLYILRGLLTSSVTQALVGFGLGTSGKMKSAVFSWTFFRVGLPAILLLLIENGTRFDALSFCNSDAAAPALRMLFLGVPMAILVMLLIDAYKGFGGLVTGFFIAGCATLVMAVQAYDIVDALSELPKWAHNLGEFTRWPFWLTCEVFAWVYVSVGSYWAIFRRRRSGLTSSDIVHPDMEELTEDHDHDDHDE